MPLSHKEIVELLSSVDTTALLELREATTPIQVQLSAPMAAALGTPHRRLTPFLAVVVDVISNKLEIDDAALKAGKVKDTKQIATWLGDNNWSIVERELYSTVVRDGIAYVLTSWTDSGPKFTGREAFNGLCGSHIHQEDGTATFGWNAWTSADASYVDFYFPERVEKYRKGTKDKDEWTPRQDSPDEAWPLSWCDSDGAPLGIALTEFNIGGSDIVDALQVARDMNETMLDMLATSRTQGWPAKWLKGQKNPDVLTNAFGQPVVNGSGNPIRRTVQLTPGSIQLIGADAEMGQLPSATIDPTLLDKLLEVLSFITTCPSHYFSGQWPSGVALIQAESRLNHRVEDHQGRLTSPIVAMLRLALRLSNFFAGTAYDPEQPITIPWHSPEIETEDLKQGRKQATEDSLTKLVAAGLMTKATAIRELHQDWSEDQIAAELAMLSGVEVAVEHP